MPDAHETLVSQASHGDAQAVDALLERYLPALRAYIRLRCDNRIKAKESCSDLVQSVCLEVLRELDGFQYQGEAAFRRWLYDKALSKIIDRNRFYQREKRDANREVAAQAMQASGGSEPAYCVSVNTPSRVLIGRERMELLEAAIGKLPEDQREVFVMSRVMGLPHKEIAEAMGRTEVATRSLLHRALVRLGALLPGD